MSLFSYIAFPSPVDKSCLKSKFDQSKAYKVGEIRGTDLEKLIEGGLSGLLPDDAMVYLGDWSDFNGIQIFDCGEALFDGVFANQHIYGLQAEFAFCDPEETIRRGMEIYHNGTEEENGGQTEAEFMAFLSNMAKEADDRAALCRQQLSDLMRLNLKPGEMVEIFSAWVDHRNIFRFGPPVETRKIDARQIAVAESLDLQDCLKWEIFHSK